MPETEVEAEAPKPKKKTGETKSTAGLAYITRLAYAAMREAILADFGDHPAKDVGDVRDWEFLLPRERHPYLMRAASVIANDDLDTDPFLQVFDFGIGAFKDLAE